MTTIIRNVPNISSTCSVSIPEKCPICKSAISPKVIEIIRNQDLFGDITTGASAAMACPACHKLFVVLYALDSNDRSLLRIDQVAPIFPAKKMFDPLLTEVSPTFIEIYNQSLASETYGLTQISGMGFRKALEFLIKDYAKILEPQESEKIENEMLSKVIQKYIDHPKIKATATASVWIGNDETHYIRKFEDKDVNDLKRLIDSCVYWILADYDASDASAMISKKA